eukprot:14681-Pelagococcus_subviridis.AAC.5
MAAGGVDRAPGAEDLAGALRSHLDLASQCTIFERYRRARNLVSSSRFDRERSGRRRRRDDTVQ